MRKFLCIHIFLIFQFIKEANGSENYLLFSKINFTNKESDLHSFYFVKNEKQKEKFLELETKITIWDDLNEIAKIITLCTVGAIAYGISHDLITTQINFDYFASDKTHHGPITRKYYPIVYKSNSKLLYALLWGTIATWWVGLPLGLGMGISARYGTYREKLTYYDLLKPVSIFLGGLLIFSLLRGSFSYYFQSKNTFNTVADMHRASYNWGALGGLCMICITYRMRPLKKVKKHRI